MNSYNDLINRARNFLEQKELESAVDNYFEALKQAPESKDKAIVWAELSWVFYGMHNFQQTIEAVENVFTFDANYGAPEDLYRLKGFALLGIGKDGEALEFLQKSVAIDRTSVKQYTTLFELAKLHFRRQNYNEAHEIIEEIEAYFYQNNRDYWLSILFYKGFIYYYSKQIEAAEEVFENLLGNAADEKRRATALYGLAFIANEKKEYLNTVNLCEAVLKADEQFFDKESLAFLTAYSFYKLDRKDIFQKYYYELKKNYPKGRYEKELKVIYENVRKEIEADKTKEQAKCN